ncbi:MULTISPECIES: chemotaxis protein CheW [Bradyrhizobium]|uniref:chemotaxis protein CheW n=1 Tax=Bradyrhizobium TaxID=374 RepID=UPI00041E6112|nr:MULTISPECIES: chemotaxis protein CheW [Bradyrhizobium]MCP1738842.1 purine-binding chemotaxis protein CheW [Bradyrhizobium japonicum]MCP1856516.1 purine-binding chemotaxis protein CheW [Bradyrhizobium japonicum]MCP1887331.1 purine-binding chemotaxis protein CheW [Bradyrhizobium japonicum]MCW2320301.1 purine-binding chemotaxis protein CheW [Bradyrhizobium japonicum]
MAATSQYLTLGLAGETFGISIRNVREILDMRPISRLPHAPNFLLGMIDVRGSGYPIVDLRTKLGLPAVEVTEATRIIILDVPMKDRLVGVGFVADCVFEVTDIDEQAIEPIPEVGGKWQSDYAAGIGRKGEASCSSCARRRIRFSQRPMRNTSSSRPTSSRTAMRSPSRRTRSTRPPAKAARS